MFKFTLCLIGITLILIAYKFDNNNHRIKNLKYQVKVNQLEIKDNEKRIKSLEQIINETANITVKATAYNAVPEQTDDDPDTTACMATPTIGSIAVSQDLYFKGWTCGKRVHIKGLGIYTIKDVMDCSNDNIYKCRKLIQVDILKETIPEALEFGVKKNLNAVLLSHYDQM